MASTGCILAATIAGYRTPIKLKKHPTAIAIPTEPITAPHETVVIDTNP
jgi:hypothetical protein